MRFADLVSDVQQIAQLTDATWKGLIQRAIRAKLSQYASAYHWPHYRTRGTILTVASYTTGTVTATAASKTITGSSTVWTSAMVGRKFRVGSENAYYDIASVDSATQITLVQAYQGSTASGSSYTIFQDEYRLNADCFLPLDLIQAQNGLLMRGYHIMDMDRWNASRDQLGDPVTFSLVGRSDETSTTGTITIAANASTVTGSGTSWTSVEGLGKGSRLAVINNSEVYTVKSVDSDTAITLYETATTAATASTYRIYLNNMRVQLHDAPNAARNIYYRYLRVPNPLINDYDEPDMPPEFDYMLAFGALEIVFLFQGKPELSQQSASKFSEWLLQQKLQIGDDSPSTTYVKETMDRRFQIFLGPLYPHTYGMPFGLLR